MIPFETMTNIEKDKLIEELYVALDELDYHYRTLEDKYENLNTLFREMQFEKRWY